MFSIDFTLLFLFSVRRMIFLTQIHSSFACQSCSVSVTIDFCHTFNVSKTATVSVLKMLTKFNRTESRLSDQERKRQQNENKNKNHFSAISAIYLRTFIFNMPINSLFFRSKSTDFHIYTCRSVTVNDTPFHYFSFPLFILRTQNRLYIVSFCLYGYNQPRRRCRLK